MAIKINDNWWRKVIKITLKLKRNLDYRYFNALIIMPGQLFCELFHKLSSRTDINRSISIQICDQIIYKMPRNTEESAFPDRIFH